MIKRLSLSRIELWSAEYINKPNERNENDKHSIIEQIEPAGDGANYIVEVYEND